VAKYTLRGLGDEVLRRFEHVWGTGWSWEKDYVHRGGSMLAAETPEGAQHFHLDHLGTPRLITNSTGVEISRHTYFPFGEEANPPAQDPEQRKFTGHERDSNGVGTSDDVDYMHARYCSPTLGRFLSADPRGGTPAEPQSFNRFTYGLNNPIRFVDPNGEAPVDIGSVTGRSARAEEFAGSVAAEFSRNTARSLLNTAKGFANAITGLGLLSTGKHPSVDSEFETLMFPSETKTDFREQVLGPIAVGLAAGRLAATPGAVATEGIYEFTGRTGRTYVGQSGNIPRRTAQHSRSGKLPPGNEPSTAEVLGGKTAREIAEQQRIDELGGIAGGNLENQVNPIGPRRQHLIEPPGN
jgi:RHS repeat-associated protein